MKRSYNPRLIVATVAIMLLMCALGIQGNADTMRINLPISETHTAEYVVSHMIRYKWDSLDTEWFFEYKDGQLNKVTWVSEASNPIKGTIEYTYDEQGRKTREVNTMYSDLGNVFLPFIYKQGDMTENIIDPETNTNTLVEVEITEYEYAEDSASVLVYIVTADGSRTLDHEEYHDAWGKLIGSSKYGYSYVVYDRYGIEIDSIRMGRIEDGEYLRPETNVNTFYDRNGNISQFVGYSETDGFTVLQFSYDDQGRIIRNIAWYASSLELEQLKIYDSNWNYNEDDSYTRQTHIYNAEPSLDSSQDIEKLITTDYASNHIPTKLIYQDLLSGKIIDEINYDVEGDPECWLSYGDDGPHIFIRYEKERDEYGNVLETRIYSGDLMKERYVYEYMLQGKE